MRSRRESPGLPVPYLDLVLNIAMGFVLLFILALLLIAEDNKVDEGKITPKAEFLIVLDWTPESGDDLDLWVRGPDGEIVSFQQKTAGIMHLDKDDLGHANDVAVVNGEEITVQINNEVVTLRGIVPGRYTVGVHFYSGGGDIVAEATVTVLDINPFREVARVTKTFDLRGQEQTMVSFTVGENGNVTVTDYIDDPFILTRRIAPPPGEFP